MNPKRKKILFLMLVGIIVVLAVGFGIRQYLAVKKANAVAITAATQANNGVSSAISGPAVLGQFGNTSDTIGTPGGISVLSRSQCTNILRAKCGKRCIFNVSKRCKSIHKCWTNGKSAYCGQL